MRSGRTADVAAERLRERATQRLQAISRRCERRLIVSAAAGLAARRRLSTECAAAVDGRVQRVVALVAALGGAGPSAQPSP